MKKITKAFIKKWSKIMQLGNFMIKPLSENTF